MVKRLTVAAAALAVIRVAVPLIPVWQGYTLGQMHALCSSWLGIYAQAASPAAARDCTVAALSWDGLDLVTAAAVVCLAAAVLLAFRSRAARGGTR